MIDFKHTVELGKRTGELGKFGVQEGEGDSYEV
jgi:hypothetical protein